MLVLKERARLPHATFFHGIRRFVIEIKAYLHIFAPAVLIPRQPTCANDVVLLGCMTNARAFTVANPAIPGCHEPPRGLDGFCDGF